MAKDVAVIGLGKLGSPMAAVFAERGHRVVGVDLDRAKVDAINNGLAPVSEAGLSEIIHASKANLRATTDTAQAVASAELTFIIVPTPSEEDGHFSVKFAVEACEEIGKGLAQASGKPIVVLTSTVMPGSMDRAVRPALERASGKRSGIDFGLCYSPEFIALGSVVRDLQYPDFYLIGESDPETGSRVEAFYKSVCRNNAPAARMNFVNAEITKISVNSYITMKISFANALARLCEQLPGGDVDVVSQAIGLDSRIGRKYISGGLGYGGPCFPRDNRAVIALGRSVGVEMPLASTTDSVNQVQLERLVSLVITNSSANATVGILGLAYKPGTEVVEESQALALADRLIQRGMTVIGFDPDAYHTARLKLPRLRISADAKSCIAESNVIVVCSRTEEFAAETDLWRRSLQSGKVVIDCWRALPRDFRSFKNYIALGVSGKSSASVRPRPSNDSSAQPDGSTHDPFVMSDNSEDYDEDHGEKYSL